ncbi:MAG: monovalent cation/H+ antiporter subunit D family protein, partial [Desulfurivibrionaceae bacterium]
KWYLVLGTLEADQIAMLVVLLVSSLLSTAYFIPVFYQAFFCSPEESQFEEKIQEAPLWCLVPVVFSSMVSLALFFYPQPFFQLAEQAVKSFSGG